MPYSVYLSLNEEKEIFGQSQGGAQHGLGTTNNDNSDSDMEYVPPQINELLQD